MKKNGKIITYSFNEVFGKTLKPKKFREAYTQELARLRIARQIREIRTKRKLTQKAVAEKAHMPQSVIARIESGKHSISLDTLGRIARVLKKEVQLV